eukprot:gnl/TRDRNA2_/TRDRNA2_31542_c0_seq2.p1 gnl/TRDRNA2_/TRDRNA2_31542_c0~~gnl/TRDRNA2_/TRDRNA2_31542_c0_seq2.p1  ORF type:complete len:842 (+),score=143.30 gnl/TRDRNA2_/TRDRNA2_31542_c0_seq2:51-2576(+)
MSLRQVFLKAPAFSKHVPVQDALVHGGNSDLPQRFRAQSKSGSSTRRRKVLCYGDSLTAGFYNYGRGFSPYGAAISGSLATEMDAEVWVCGMVGCTAKEMAEKLRAPADGRSLVDMCKRSGRGLEWILEKNGPFDLVLIMAGANDLAYAGGNVETIMPHIEMLHRTCHSRHTRTVALSVPPNQPLYSDPDYAHNWHLVNNAVYKFAHGDGKDDESTVGTALFVNTREYVPFDNANKHLWDKDGLHFTPEGSKRLAQCLAPRLLPLLRTTPNMSGRPAAKVTDDSSSASMLSRLLEEQRTIRAEIMKLQQRLSDNDKLISSLTAGSTCAAQPQATHPIPDPRGGPSSDVYAAAGGYPLTLQASPKPQPRAVSSTQPAVTQTCSSAAAASRGRAPVQDMRPAGGHPVTVHSPKRERSCSPHSQHGDSTCKDEKSTPRGYHAFSTPGSVPCYNREVRLEKPVLFKVAQESAAKTQEIWEEPAERKVAIGDIDRCEELLKAALMRNRDLFRRKANTTPVEAVRSLLAKLGKNNSDKLDMDQFVAMADYLKFDCSAKVLARLFQRYDVDRSGCLGPEELGRLLMRDGIGPADKAKICIAKMREVLSRRVGGFPTMKAIFAQYRVVDRDRSGKLSREEFNMALDTLFKAYRVTFSIAEKNTLFQYFDKDNSGNVSYDEYMRAVRGDMNKFRLKWVKQAFDILDRDGNGIVTMNDIAHSYDVSTNPSVKAEDMSANDAYALFMKNYDTSKDGVVTFDEFVENYQWVSASIEDDAYFELMMRNAWRIPGGDGASQNTANLRVLVQYSDGTEKVVAVQDDRGLDKNDYCEVMRRLQNQGVKSMRSFKLYA